MTKIKPILDMSEKILAAICVLFFITMFALGVATVLFRFVIQSSLAFPDEMIRYLFVWIIALGSAVGLRRNIHAAIGVIVNALPDRSRRAALLFSSFCTALFLAILVEKGWNVTILEAAQISPALEVSMAWVYSAVPIGAACGLLYAIEAFFSQLTVPLSDLSADDH